MLLGAKKEIKVLSRVPVFYRFVKSVFDLADNTPIPQPKCPPDRFEGRTVLQNPTYNLHEVSVQLRDRKRTI